MTLGVGRQACLLIHSAKCVSYLVRQQRGKVSSSASYSLEPLLRVRQLVFVLLGHFFLAMAPSLAQSPLCAVFISV